MRHRRIAPMRTRSGSAALTRIAAVLVLCASAGAHAESSLHPQQLGFAWANGGKVNVFAISARWDPQWRHAWLAERDLGVYVDGQIAYWDGYEEPAKVSNLWDFAAMGVLRWTPQVAWGRPFAEGAFGIHLLTHAQINSSRDFSSAFQFGSRASVGFAFGPQGKYEVAAFVEHVSNAGLWPPNYGITYTGIVIRAALP